MKKIIFSLLVLLLLIISLPLPSQATVYGNTVFQNGQTYINFIVNWQYPSIEKVLTEDIFLFELTRQDLAAANKIIDKKVLIETGTYYGDTSMALIKEEKNCGLSHADQGGEPDPIGECYFISTDTQDPKLLLAMIFSLQDLNGSATEINLKSADLLNKYRSDVDSVLQNKNYFYPVWSADSQYVAVVFKQNNKNQIELFDANTGQNKILENPKGDLLTVPIWSPDKRFLVYASLLEIKIYNAQNQTTKTVDLSKYFQIGNELYLNFSQGAGLMYFSEDQNLYNMYPVYKYNFDYMPEVEKVSEDNNQPCCSHTVNGPAYGERVGVVSPNGDKVAQIYLEDSLRKFKISEFNIVNNNLNQIPENEKTINPEPIAEPEVRPAFIITDILPGNMELIIIGSALGLALILLVIVIIKLFKR